MSRGGFWWAPFPAPPGRGRATAARSLVVQADAFNRSRVDTLIVAIIAGNPAVAAAPCNVELPRRGTGLRKKSAVNVSQVVTRDWALLTRCAGRAPGAVLDCVDEGLPLLPDL